MEQLTCRSLPESSTMPVLTPLPSAIYRALGKDTLCRVPDPKHSAKSRHSAKPPLPSARHSAKTWHSAKNHLCRVSLPGTRQIINFFFLLNLNFFYLHIQHVVPHSQVWCIFEFICYILLINLIFGNFESSQIWTASHSNIWKKWVENLYSYYSTDIEDLFMKSKENSNMLLRKHDLDRVPERILSSIKSKRSSKIMKFDKMLRYPMWRLW